MSYSGGSLGTGATAEWYDDAAFTSNVGSGNNLTIAAPNVTTTYYVRFEGTCNNTAAQSVTITVDNASSAPTSASVDNANYCDNAAPANITLSYSGGSLGTGATAEWYDDAAFTNNVGSGNNLTLAAPTTTTTYYVRFEGTCGNTTAQSVTVTVDLASSDPTSATADITNYCDDASAPTNIVLSYSGGSLGTGATAEWYDDAAFTSNVGSGNNLTIAAPNVTTTYYVRFEGTCNNTAAQSVTITVDNASTAPTSASVDNANYCDNAAPANITLSYTGGSLGTGATAEWYDDAAFTNNVGSGNNLTLAAPTTTTTYYVRFEGTCGNTTAQSVTVTVDLASSDPTSATADITNYCDDASAPTNIVLSYSGGSLGTGATAEWYDDAAFTSNVGSGNNLTIAAPNVTTTYYVRFEGTCNNTAAQSVTITVDNASSAPTSASVDNATYCANAVPANITLSYSGGSLGTGASAQWYADAGFTINVGSGNNLTVNAPDTTTTYYVRFEGTCNITSAQQVVVDVVAPPDATISGAPAVCENTTETYTVPAGAATYNWALTGGDGTITSGQGTNSVTVDWLTAGGDLSVTVTGAAPTSCVSTQTLTVTVYGSVPSLPNQSTNVCQNGSYPTLIATPVAGAVVRWYLGSSATGTLVATGDTFTPTAAELDITTVGTTTFTYIQDIGCLASPDATYDVFVLPEPNAGLDSASSACMSDGPVDLSQRLGGTPDSGGAWNDDDGSGALTGSIVDPAVSGPGTFNFSYIVTGSGACAGRADTAVVTLTVIGASLPPVPDQSDYMACTYGDPPTLNATGSGITWYSDAALTDAVGSGNSFTPVDGQHIDMQTIGTTTFYVTQDEGCGESTAAEVNVILDGVEAEIGEVQDSYPEQDVGAIEVINMTSDDPPFEVSLEDDAGTVIYDWQAVEEDRLGNYTYQFTRLASGNYVAKVRDTKGCIRPLNVTIGLKTEVFIPNVFTPNGDGYNDYFKVLNKQPNTKIVITNRWGVKVFESDDYQNDWQAENLPEGVYFYVIEMGGQVYRGNVEVWRYKSSDSN